VYPVVSHGPLITGASYGAAAVAFYGSSLPKVLTYFISLYGSKFSAEASADAPKAAAFT
jgi:hypothetical protein